MKLFSNDLGIDLGTANTRIYVDNQGVKLREPSVVALERSTGKTLKVGAEAERMLNRTPGNVVAMHPLKDGVVSDDELTAKMLKEFYTAVSGGTLLSPKPRVVISVPSGVTQVEERTVINAALNAGARRAYLVEAPLAAALGAGLDISGPEGHLVVDIGCGTTDAAILSMNGVVVSDSIQIAGSTFDEAISHYVRQAYSLVIGDSVAEDIKIQIGSVMPRPEVLRMRVRGRDYTTGKPLEVELASDEIQRVLHGIAQHIVDMVLSLLDKATPELHSDISKNGIVLTGGGSQLFGLAQLLSERVGIPCTLADDPGSCVAFGCGKSLSWINHMTEGILNLARRRAMRA